MSFISIGQLATAFQGLWALWSRFEVSLQVLLLVDNMPLSMLKDRAVGYSFGLTFMVYVRRLYAFNICCPSFSTICVPFAALVTLSRTSVYVSTLCFSRSTCVVSQRLTYTLSAFDLCLQCFLSIYAVLLGLTGHSQPRWVDTQCLAYAFGAFGLSLQCFLSIFAGLVALFIASVDRLLAFNLWFRCIWPIFSVLLAILLCQPCISQPLWVYFMHLTYAFGAFSLSVQCILTTFAR